MNGSEEVPTPETLRRSLRRLVTATVVLYLGLFSLGYYIYTVSRNNTDGLCTLRNEAATRVQTSQEYLIDHPNGSKEIPLGVIKLSIANSQRTVDALRNIRCPPPNI
jgi:hypothetical protein